MVNLSQARASANEKVQTRYQTASRAGGSGFPKSLLSEMLDNLSQLEHSVSKSHTAERLIFQSQLQLQIDSHCLQVELAAEKTKTERLKHLNECELDYLSRPKESQSELRYFQRKCQDLTLLLRKRSNQLYKARSRIQDLKVETQRLQGKLKARNAKLREVTSDFNETITQLSEEMERRQDLAAEAQSRSDGSALQVALRQEINRNKQLAYFNCRLKSQIAFSKRANRFNMSTQVSLEDKPHDLTG